MQKILNLKRRIGQRVAEGGACPDNLRVAIGRGAESRHTFKYADFQKGKCHGHTTSHPLTVLLEASGAIHPKAFAVANIHKLTSTPVASVKENVYPIDLSSCAR